MLISHTILWFLLLSPIIKYYNVPSCACYRVLSYAIFCYPMLSCAISCYLMLISHTIMWYLLLSPNFNYYDVLSCAILCYPLVLCLISQTFWLTHWLSEWVTYIYAISSIGHLTKLTDRDRLRDGIKSWEFWQGWGKLGQLAWPGARQGVMIELRDWSQEWEIANIFYLF